MLGGIILITSMPLGLSLTLRGISMSRLACRSLITLGSFSEGGHFG